MTLKVCFAKSSDFIQLRLLLLLLRFPDHQACHLLRIPLPHNLLVYMEFLSRLPFPEEYDEEESKEDDTLDDLEIVEEGEEGVAE